MSRFLCNLTRFLAIAVLVAGLLVFLLSMIAFNPAPKQCVGCLVIFLPQDLPSDGRSGGVESKDSAGMPGTGHATPRLECSGGGDALSAVTSEIKTGWSKSRHLSRRSARPAQLFIRGGPFLEKALDAEAVYGAAPTAKERMR